MYNQLFSYDQERFFSNTMASDSIEFENLFGGKTALKPYSFNRNPTVALIGLLFTKSNSGLSIFPHVVVSDVSKR